MAGKLRESLPLPHKRLFTHFFLLCMMMMTNASFAERLMGHLTTDIFEESVFDGVLQKEGRFVDKIDENQFLHKRDHHHDQERNGGWTLYEAERDSPVNPIALVNTVGLSGLLGLFAIEVVGTLLPFIPFVTLAKMAVPVMALTIALSGLLPSITGG